MKTETQIAEEDINFRRLLIRSASNFEKCDVQMRRRMISHKASCQRFLGFLNIHDKQDYRGCGSRSFVEEKITDLKQAIKLYEDNGI